MADMNNERVGKTLALLSQGLEPFVERECSGALGPGWTGHQRLEAETPVAGQGTLV